MATTTKEKKKVTKKVKKTPKKKTLWDLALEMEKKTMIKVLDKKAVYGQ